MDHPVEKPVSQSLPPQKPSLFARLGLWHLVAASIWGYLILKLFIFDVDIFLIKRYFPKCLWIVEFKAVWLFLALAIFSLFAKQLLWRIVYVVFYPLLLSVWFIPRLIWKQKSWVLVIAIANTLIAAFTNWRYHLLTKSLFSLAVIAILSSDNQILLACSIFVLVLMIVSEYFHRFVLVFKKSAVYQAHRKLFTGMAKFGAKCAFVEADVISVDFDQLTSQQRKTWVTNLEMAVATSRLCLLTSRKLKEYLSSGASTVASVFAVVLLFTFTVITFGFVNYGLYKIDPHSFSTSADLTRFTFFYYSFKTMIFNSTEGLKPNSAVAKVFYMLQCSLVLVLTAIFTAILLFVRKEREAEELNLTATCVADEGLAVEKAILAGYRVVSVDAAISELRKAKSGLVGFICEISKGL